MQDETWGSVVQNKLQFSFIVALCIAGASAGRAQAQSAAAFTLRDAVAMALDKNPDRKIAQSDVAAARIGSRMARTSLLPNLGFSEGVTRGDDPVYVFGTLLRQQQFGQANFALNNLNRPHPVNNLTSRFAGQWVAFDSFRTELEMRKTDLQSRSAQASLSRSDQEIAHHVVASYEGILFAAKYVEVAQHAVDTAKALLDSSKSRVDAGMAVDSDQLVASSNLAERQQERIEAEGNLEIAWAQLERAIGAPIPAEQRHLQDLAEKTFDVRPLGDAVSLALQSRQDRESLKQQLAAQKVGVQSAKSGYGPTISTFGSWETDRASIAGSGGNNWTAGAELRVDLLPAAKRQQVAAAKIALERMEAASTSADDEIRLEVTQAWYAHRSASQKLEVARASVARAEESLRILKDRYESGLATVTELLRVEDAQRQSTANYWQTVFGNTLTYADLQFAMGTLNPANQEDLQ